MSVGAAQVQLANRAREDPRVGAQRTGTLPATDRHTDHEQIAHTKTRNSPVGDVEGGTVGEYVGDAASIATERAGAREG